ncbi:MAG: DUF3572 domain-containing protein [Pseudomonadota bacterium]
MRVKQEMAETYALKALAWMAEDSEIMGQFLGWSGADAADLAQIGSAPEMMLSVIDFILMQDEWVIDASAAIGLPPEKFAGLRGAFPGGAETHWQ